VSRRPDRTDCLLTSTAMVLSVAFMLRVVGQAVQLWVPQSWLPPFSEWQGSAIPYPFLLAAQVVILGVVAFVLTRMAQGRRMLGRRACFVVIGAGAVYFAVMAARLLLGIFWLTDSQWFTAWISTSFHLVLASVVLIWGWQQLRFTRCDNRRSVRRSCG